MDHSCNPSNEKSCGFLKIVQLNPLWLFKKCCRGMKMFTLEAASADEELPQLTPHTVQYWQEVTAQLLIAQEIQALIQPCCHTITTNFTFCRWKGKTVLYCCEGISIKSHKYRRCRITRKWVATEQTLKTKHKLCFPFEQMSSFCADMTKTQLRHYVNFHHAPLLYNRFCVKEVRYVLVHPHTEMCANCPSDEE